MRLAKTLNTQTLPSGMTEVIKSPIPHYHICKVWHVNGQEQRKEVYSIHSNVTLATIELRKLREMFPECKFNMSVTYD